MKLEISTPNSQLPVLLRGTPIKQSKHFLLYHHTEYTGRNTGNSNYLTGEVNVLHEAHVYLLPVTPNNTSNARLRGNDRQGVEIQSCFVAEQYHGG